MAKETDKRWKGLLQDWPTVADMDTEEFEFKALNQQQVAILLSAISVYRWQTRWIDLDIDKDELEKLISEIELRLMQNESGGGFLMTPEEYYDAHKRATYDAWNDIAKQVVSGKTTNFNVGADGVVTDPTTGIPNEPLPEDDPSTPYDETLAAEMGAAIEQSKAVELFLDKLDAYYGITNGSPTTTADDAKIGIFLYFPCDEAAMDTAISLYYLWRNTNNRILFDTSEAQQNFMFCKGLGLTAWNKWMIDQSAWAGSKIQAVSNLTNSLSPEFWSQYYSSGSKKPATQYLDAPCVPIETQTLLSMVFASARTTTPLKASHRMLMTVKGYALDVDGDIQDWFWYRTAAGVNTFTAPTFTHSGGSNLPSQTEVPYKANHEYSYTIDLGALNAAMIITLNKHASMNAAGLTYPVPFEITLTDLGESTVL